MGFSSVKSLFNKYEIGKLLGCGAFAKVYHGRDVSTGKSVALKILEVLATKRKIFIVMEYLKGGELFTIVEKGRFSEDLGRKYFRQLISAVSFCHQRGVYHRDLKLENMLVDENGELKVSDFGLSALSDSVRSDGMLHTLCGTPAYVAPEVLAKKGYDGAKVDVWSCGVSLFVLMTGYLPFNDHNLMNMYRKIYRGKFQCPKWMSPHLRQFISRLLNTNPATRITIDEIKQDPWFNHGYSEAKSEDLNIDLDLDLYLPTDFNSSEKKPLISHLNAFHMISFSRGLDLSGMFHKSRQSTEDVHRLIVEESPEGVMEKVEAAVKSAAGGVRLRRIGGYCVELHGQNGNFGGTLEVYLLTEVVVVVEVKYKAGDVAAFSKLWKDKIRPVIHVSSNH